MICKFSLPKNSTRWNQADNITSCLLHSSLTLLIEKRKNRNRKKLCFNNQSAGNTLFILTIFTLQNINLVFKGVKSFVLILLNWIKSSRPLIAFRILLNGNGKEMFVHKINSLSKADH